MACTRLFVLSMSCVRSKPVSRENMTSWIVLELEISLSNMAKGMSPIGIEKLLVEI